MLHHLTNYLLQYKSVAVPFVGRLQLVQRSPVLNIADKKIEPPSYVVQLESPDDIADHQWQFLQEATAADKDTVRKNLDLFGHTIKTQMANGGFDWKGIGLIKHDTQELLVSVPAFEPLTAEKVIRQNATHNVLIGDHETNTARLRQNSEAAPSRRKKKNLSVVIGWVVLALALLAIGFVLISGSFNVNAAGSRLSPDTWIKLNE